MESISFVAHNAQWSTQWKVMYIYTSISVITHYSNSFPNTNPSTKTLTLTLNKLEP